MTTIRPTHAGVDIIIKPQSGIEPLYQEFYQNKKQQNKVMKSIKMEIPEGYEVDEEKSTFTEIVFKKIKRSLPKSWAGLESISGYYVTSISYVTFYEDKGVKGTGKNTWPTKELADAALALSQLCMLRDAWRQGWEPNYGDNFTKFGISTYGDAVMTDNSMGANKIICFQTSEIRDDFKTTFRDLLETAKPLL